MTNYPNQVYHDYAASCARHAEDSGADHWMRRYTEQCRQGEREQMFTPRPADRPKR